jgi:hypothetical protein
MKLLAIVLLWMLMVFGLYAASPASADASCAPGGPPPGAATKDVSATYGQPATLWITSADLTGISTAGGTGSITVHTASPIVQQALLIDAQQDGSHQILLDTGRETNLYAASGCTVSTVVDKQGKPFVFDEGHRRGNGDGVGCGDLGNGPHLVGVLNLPDQPGLMRRTEIDLDGTTATIGRSDVVPQTTDLSCGGLTMQRDGLEAPY